MMKKLFAKVAGTRRLFAICIALGMTGGILIIMEAAGLARIADRAFLGGIGLTSLLPVFGILLGLIALRAVVQTASEWVSAQMALRIKSDLRQRLLHKLSELGPNYAKGERGGELIGTLYEGVEQLESYLARYLPQMALSMLVPAAVFCVVMGLDWISAIVLAITLPLLVLFMILVGLAAKSKAKQQFKSFGLLSGHFLDVVRGLPTLKMFNRSRAQIEIIARISEDYRKTTMGTLRLAFLSAFVMELFATLSTAIVAVFLGLRLIAGEIGFEHAFLVLLLTPEFYSPVRALGTQFHASTNGMSAAARILDILETEPPGFIEQKGAKQAISNQKGYRIEFQGVSVCYPGEKKSALTDMTFTLEPGERIAVIGLTGSGKSTLLDLLQGFIQPASGRILIDGIDMAELSMDWWRSQLSGVAQNPRLYHGTLKENLTMGSPGTEEAGIAAALRAAGADFIGKLPQGLETEVGDSVRLSGGQVQRLAIARALLKRTPVLLLDEPTSGLDLIHEAAVRQGLAALLKDCMSVTVAHRLETVQDADRMIVIADGRIAEIGCPAELLASGGLYARMINADIREEADSDGIRSGRGSAEEYEAVEPGAAAVLGAAASVSAKAVDGSKDSGVQRGTFLRMLEFVRPYKGRTALAALLGFATVAANIGLMGTSGYLIARAALQPESVLMLWTLIVGVRFFGIARGTLRYLERLVSHDLTFRILHRVRVWLYKNLEPEGAALLESRRSGDVLNAIIGDVEQLQNLYLRVLAPPLVASLTGLLCFTVMAVHDLRLACILGGMMLVSGVGIPWVCGHCGRKHGEGVVQARASMNAEMADLIAGMKELTLFGRMSDRLARIGEIQNRSNSFQSSHNRLGAYASGGMLAVSHVTMWLVLLVSVYLVGTGRIEGISIPALAMMTLACFEAIMPLPAAFQHIAQTMSSADRLFRLADQNRSAGEAEPITQGETARQPADSDRSNGGWEARIEDLSFRYGSRESYAVRNLSLTLKQGKSIALVGESGAGKSTLLQVLLRMRSYTEGSVTINGQELSDLPEDFVRSEFAVVSQNVQLFNTSAAANLKLGCPDATDEELRAAARLALIDDTLAGLPDGYDTVIGEWGARLSGGERQRLALARALLRQSPAVLFDEPATGLDALTARAFIDNMDTLLKDKAALWITHKLSGLERMDEIIVLQEGYIQERGTHQELLQRKGYYWRLWQLERERDWKHALIHRRNGA